MQISLSFPPFTAPEEPIKKLTRASFKQVFVDAAQGGTLSVLNKTGAA